MKLNINKPKYGIAVIVYLGGCLCLLPATLTAQDSTGAVVETPPLLNETSKKYISKYLDHRQPNCLVPVKKTFEMDIQHRFGTVENGYEDFWGFFAPSNIRMGFSYVP